MALKTVAPRLSRAPRRLSPPVKIADPFYARPDWRQFSADMKRQRGYRCEKCGRDWSDKRWLLTCDHIEERRDGGADFDPLNIQILGPCCDRAKTAEARRAREKRLEAEE